MRRRHKRDREQADLDITAFMNLMIVLVPILLINMIFAHTSVIELNFPESQELSVEENEDVQLQVVIYPDKLLVSDDKGSVIKEIDNIDTAYDYKLLTETMKELKSRVPEKRDILVMAEQATSYQTLISVMDRVSSYETVVAGSLVRAELFPDISIADTPESDSETRS